MKKYLCQNRSCIGRDEGRSRPLRQVSARREIRVGLDLTFGADGPSEKTSGIGPNGFIRLSASGNHVRMGNVARRAGGRHREVLWARSERDHHQVHKYHMKGV